MLSRFERVGSLSRLVSPKLGGALLSCASALGFKEEASLLYNIVGMLFLLPILS